MLREAALLIALGLVIGYGSSFWLGRYLESQLYGVGAAAAGISAFRASRIEPMTALRQD